MPQLLLLGQTITCCSCDTSFEVIWTDPLELDVYYFEGEELLYGSHKAMNSDKKNRVNCPQCNKNIPVIKKVWIGDRLTCISCGMEFQVIGLNPIEIDLPYDGTNENFMDEDYGESHYDLYKKIDF